MMPKFSVNYQELANSVSYVQKETFKLADVKHKLEKVAFDVVRFKDGNPDELWQIQNSDDGDYIVAKYDEEKEEKVAESFWNVSVTASDINVFYKGQQITKLAAAKLGLDSQDLPTVKRFLPTKLASDKNMVSALLSTLDKPTKDSILKLYPELL